MAKTPTEIASLARSSAKSALMTLAAIMRQPKAPAAARVAAAVALLDRGWGKPKQTVGGVMSSCHVVSRNGVQVNATDRRRDVELPCRQSKWSASQCDRPY